MRKLLALALVALVAFAPLAFGQICDVTYSWESETMDGQDVGNGTATFFAQPMSEVEFNHKAQRKVLDAMSKEQDAKKHGIYRTDVSEYRACDGGGKVKIADGSASIQGVSYAGANRIMDEVIRQMRIINDHHKGRNAQGHKHAWDHGKAKKVRRNDLHQKIKD